MARRAATLVENALDILVEAMEQLKLDRDWEEEMGNRYGHLTKARRAIERAFDNAKKAKHYIKRGELP